MGFFFSVNTCPVFDPWLGVMGAEGRLYALIYALYRGLEHPWIWVSAGVLEPIPHEYQGTAKFWGSQKLYADVFTVQGWEVLLTLHVVQGSTAVEDKAGEHVEPRL